MHTIVLYLGRVLFGGFFIYSGYNHFAHLGAMAGYTQSKGVPSAKAAVAITGALLLIGGLSTLFNFYPLIGLSALVIFLVPVTFVMHAYWKVQDPMAKMGESVNFRKNLALLGATLIYMASLFN
ncbi:MAG TPA: DoxX family protein [Bacteroidota bacterium]|nr:DoxX family protein [Bacteroidota bacterium]